MTVKKMAPHPRLFITQQARKDRNRSRGSKAEMA